MMMMVKMRTMMKMMMASPWILCSRFQSRVLKAKISRLLLHSKSSHKHQFDDHDDARHDEDNDDDDDDGNDDDDDHGNDDGKDDGDGNDDDDVLSSAA